MNARELMSDDLKVVTPNDTLSRAAEIMRDADVGLVPVVDDPSSMQLRGVITDRDIAVRHVAERHSDDCPVSAHMTSETLDTVGPDDDADEVMRLMAEDQVRRVLVAEGGRLVGIIAQADLTRRLGNDRAVEVERTVERISEPTR
jgi:CBS domain-containing protein